LRPEVGLFIQIRFVPKVVGELLAVAGVMQQAVDVVEDVPLGDLLVAVVLAEVRPDRP